MSCRQVAIFSRFIRRRQNQLARVRVLEEEGLTIGTAGVRAFHGCHGLLNFRSKSTVLRQYMCIHFADYTYFTSNLYKSSLSSTNNRSLMTSNSVNREKVVKDLENILSVAQDMTLSTEEMCSMYITKLVTSGNLADAAYLLEYLQNREIHLELNTYNTLLNAAYEANDFNIFAEIFEKLLLSNVPPDFSSYVNVARAFLKTSDTNRLLKFIRDVSEITADKEPTVMNRIIFVTAKTGQLEKSLLFFAELKKLKAKIDTVTFNTVLVMLGRAGKVDQMLSEFNSMKDLGHVPDTVTYNTLVNCLRRMGKFEMCKSFVKEMVEREIYIDLRTYTALIDAFGRAGHVNEAKQMFDYMQKSHRPSVYVYRAMISNLRKACKYEDALSLWEEMNSATLKLVGPEDFKRKKRKTRSMKAGLRCS